jgi:hypothetical protein
VGVHPAGQHLLCARFACVPQLIGLLGHIRA